MHCVFQFNVIKDLGMVLFQNAAFLMVGAVIESFPAVASRIQMAGLLSLCLEDISDLLRECSLFGAVRFSLGFFVCSS